MTFNINGFAFAPAPVTSGQTGHDVARIFGLELETDCD